jgi:quinol monooxygenase YgiN
MDSIGRIVIACYRPKPGQTDALAALVRAHVRRLRAEGLVTDREPIAMVAADGTILEVFEWVSAEAIAAAHTNAVVQQMWEEFTAVADYVPVAAVPEAHQMFSEFAPIS